MKFNKVIRRAFVSAYTDDILCRFFYFLAIRLRFYSPEFIQFNENACEVKIEARQMNPDEFAINLNNGASRFCQDRLRFFLIS